MGFRSNTKSNLLLWLSYYTFLHDKLQTFGETNVTSPDNYNLGHGFGRLVELFHTDNQRSR